MKNCKICKTRAALYNFYNEEKLAPEYCGGCKLPKMINVRNKRCFCGAVAHPIFGPEEGGKTHCFNCKEDGMINKSKRCVCGKITHPVFAKLGQKPFHCQSCKLEGMINVESVSYTHLTLPTTPYV